MIILNYKKYLLMKKLIGMIKREYLKDFDWQVVISLVLMLIIIFEVIGFYKIFVHMYYAH